MTSHEPGKLVLPGDLLGAAEEYVPGRGTYEHNGQVFAALMGHPHFDSANRTVTVKAIHEIPHMTEGELLYARVEDIKSSMLICQLLTSVTTGRDVPGFPEGTVHVSKAKEAYVESLAAEFSVGDLLKAKVLQGYPSVKLSTQSEDCGVVSARCTDCHGLLARADRDLVCTRCGRREHRKISSDYGGVAPGTHHRAGQAAEAARPSSFADAPTSPSA